MAAMFDDEEDVAVYARDIDIHADSNTKELVVTSKKSRQQGHIEDVTEIPASVI